MTGPRSIQGEGTSTDQHDVRAPGIVEPDDFDEEAGE
jgi:hypothetical protein